MTVPSAVSTRILGGPSLTVTKRSPARTRTSRGAVRLRRDTVPSSWLTSSPVIGSGSACPFRIGRTVSRTVCGLTDKTVISTGWPAIIKSCPRRRMISPPKVSPLSANPAPIAPSRLSAARRELGSGTVSPRVQGELYWIHYTIKPPTALLTRDTDEDIASGLRDHFGPPIHARADWRRVGAGRRGT